jgi:signal transduction histidine kinase
VAIAELHGGRLSLENGLPRGTGYGLEARLTLPLAA